MKTFRNFLQCFALQLIIVVSYEVALAVPVTMNFQGRILRSDGSPLNYPHVSFTFEVADPTGTCIIYREQVSNINIQNGVFDVRWGETHLFPANPLFTVHDSFDNSKNQNCQGGSVYTPASGDTRLLKVQFHDGVAWRQISPHTSIGSVPYAGSSLSAKKSQDADRLGGQLATAYLRKTEINGNVSCGSGDFLTWNAATLSFGCATPSGGGAATLAGDVSGAVGATSVDAIKGKSVVPAAYATGQVLRYNGANWVNALIDVSTDVTGTLPISRGGTGATSQSAAINNLLPSQTGNANKILQTDGTNVSWVNTPASGITALTGEVTASGSGSVPATIASNAVTSAKILDATINGADMDFTGVNAATASLVMKDATGKFYNFACSTTGHVPTWTVTGFACQAPILSETDPKVGANTTNMLSKWDGAALVASGVYENGGSVGIGTSTPSEKLEVIGKVKATELCIGADCKSAWPSGGGGGTVTEVTAGAGLTGGAITASGTIGLGTELAGLNSLSSTGFMKRTAAGAYSTVNSINLASEVTGTLPVANGGTGAATVSAAINNLLPSQAANANKILQTNGTNVSWVDTPTTGMTTLTGDVTATGTGSVSTTIANNAVTSAKILNGTILSADMDFTGANAATSGFVMKDSGGKFYNFTCSTTGHVPTWTVAGFACQAPTLSETDPKVGANTSNMLSKWNGSALVASGVYENGGNVGIGTTSPAFQLDIRTNFTSANWNGQSFIYHYVSGAASANNYSAGISAMAENAVTGAFLNESRAVHAQTKSANDAHAQRLIGNFVEMESYPGDTHFGIYVQNMTGGTSTGGTAYGVYLDLWDADVTNYGIYQATANNNYFAGKLGLGASSPKGVIHVHSTTPAGTIATSGTAVTGTGTNFTAVFAVGDQITAAGQVRDIAAISSATSLTLSSAFSSNLAAGTKYFKTGAIFNAGNVGIGTTSPLAALDIMGSLIISPVVGDHTDIAHNMAWSSAAGAWFSRNGGPGSHIQLGGGSGNTSWISFLVTNAATGTAAGASLTMKEALKIDNNGNIGVGIASPSYALHVVGDTYTSGYFRSPNGTIQTSDVRFKRNITSIDRSLDKILSLRGVTYDWKRKEFPERSFSDRRQMGVIAQEVEASFPEAVVTDGKGYKSVNYSSLVAPLINAVKELYALIGGQERRIDSIEKENQSKDEEINNLKKRNTELEARLNRIEKILEGN